MEALGKGDFVREADDVSRAESDPISLTLPQASLSKTSLPPATLPQAAISIPICRAQAALHSLPNFAKPPSIGS